MIAYFDASAFLKLVIDEPGRPEALEVWGSAHRRVSSLLLYPEVRAGLARAHRMRRIGRTRLRAAADEVENLCDEAVLLDVTEDLARHAGALAEEHGLRAYDAVHLASLNEIADNQIVLVAADGDLVRAARAYGITTVTL